MAIKKATAEVINFDSGLALIAHCDYYYYYTTAIRHWESSIIITAILDFAFGSVK